MAEIRFVTSNEFKEAAALADSIFRDKDHSSMAHAFPHIFSGSLNHSFGAFENGIMVAFMGVVPKIIHIGQSQLQVHCLGSVCTASEARGKGYASLMLDQVYQFIEQAGSSLLLVSGDRTLYTRTGCVHFGSIKHYSLNEQNIANKLLSNNDGAIIFRQYEAKDAFQLHLLQKNRKVRFEESIYDTSQLVEGQAIASIHKLDQHIYVAEQAGQLVSAVIVAVQAKQLSQASSRIIEWYGDAEVTIALLAHILTKHTIPSLELYTPWHEQDMHQALTGISYTSIPNAGTIKMINVKRLWKQLQPYLIEKDEEAANQMYLIESEAAEIIHLRIMGDLITLSYEQFVRLLFDADVQIPDLQPYHETIIRLFPIAFPQTEGLHYI